ncbi:mechanosensitive ion channel family protein [Asticcacaulis biprosthecium]|uniref:mechanosensitive ion channel family protein n=1 Tax=Asticcacaulis biprosthecium TaxID=76891 RepID=UPI0002D7D300|nr:mechanosensitive ion channel family protein [Asticcacaulis biprosthecium]
MTAEPAAPSADLLDRLLNYPDILGNIAVACIILLITLWVSKWLADGAKKLVRRFVQNDADRTLPEFLSQVIRWLLLTVGLVAALNRLGVETTSFIAVLGAASLAIGLALQGTLGNVAAGLMILFNRPYRIGDSVKIGEVSGTVHRLGLFATEINNGDNVRVFVPNTKIFSNEISNLTTNGAVRIEVKLDVGMATDLPACLALLLRVAKDQPGRMAAPEPWVAVQDFAQSGMTIRIAIWVMPSDVLASRTRLILDVKSALDAAEIEVPYPHQVSLEHSGQ